MIFKKILVIVIYVLAISSCATTLKNETVPSDARLEAGIFDGVKIDQFDGHRFVSSRGTTLMYRVLRPLDEVQGRTYPLVVQLHGSGGIGTDNLKQMELLAKTWAMPDVRSRYNAFVLIPQFPIRSANYGPRAPDRFAEKSPALDDAIDLIRDFAATHPVDRKRIYATGFSMGASTTWLLPQHAPDLFAAIVPFSGVAPPNSEANKFIRLPALVMHGNADTENEVITAHRFVKAIRAEGGRDIRLREYEGLVHSPPTDAYPGYWWRDWMFAQRRR